MNDAELSSLRPLTRSSLKPKLLFPSTKTKSEQITAAVTDEEALTELEDQVQSRSDQIVTPIRSSFEPVSPPTTGHVTRSTTQQSQTNAPAEGNVSEAAEPPPLRRKKVSPFDSWQRTKASRSASRGKKRDADEMETIAAEEGGKRLRTSTTAS